MVDKYTIKIPKYLKTVVLFSTGRELFIISREICKLIPLQVYTFLFQILWVIGKFLYSFEITKIIINCIINFIPYFFYSNWYMISATITIYHTPTPGTTMSFILSAVIIFTAAFKIYLVLEATIILIVYIKKKFFSNRLVDYATEYISKDTINNLYKTLLSLVFILKTNAWLYSAFLNNNFYLSLALLDIYTIYSVTIVNILIYIYIKKNKILFYNYKKDK